MHLLSLVVLSASSLSTVSAWGTLGHTTVGFIAQNFLEDQTVTWAQDILDIRNDSYLASVATWADSYRYTAAGSFSAPYHFIDAEDKPPSSCSVDFDRDCSAEGCVVSAIANYVRPTYKSPLHPFQSLTHRRPPVFKTAASPHPTRNKPSSSSSTSLAT